MAELVPASLPFVMAGLVPAIHVFLGGAKGSQTWMPGTEAGHDEWREPGTRLVLGPAEGRTRVPGMTGGGGRA